MYNSYDELLARLRETTSATATLARWVGVDSLSLDRVTAETNYRLSERDRELLDPHPGVFYGYRRTALLCVPGPAWRSVASVSAVVLTSRLSPAFAQLVLAADAPLGGIMLAAGAWREFIRATRGGRTDESGRAVGLRVEARFVLDGESVALVREDVYEDVIRDVYQRA